MFTLTIAHAMLIRCWSTENNANRIFSHQGRGRKVHGGREEACKLHHAREIFDVGLTSSMWQALCQAKAGATRSKAGVALETEIRGM